MRQIVARWRASLALHAPLLSSILLLAVVGCSDLGKSVEPPPPAGHAELSPATLDFGTIAAGDTAVLQTTLTNSGDTELSGTVATSGAQFLVPSGAGAFTLPPGQSLTVSVDFAPQAEGMFTGELTFGPSGPSASLVGACSNPGPGFACEVVPSSLAFGTVSTGQTATKSFVIRSVGTADLPVDVVASCADFSITAGGGAKSIAPGDSVTVSVRYAPTAVGPSTCTVTVGAGCPTVGLSGAGSEPALVSFARDVQPIYTASCATSGCHRGSSPDGHLNLSAGVAYAQSVNRVSNKYSPHLLIKPNDPSGSVIYGKIANTGQYGGRMPENRSLTSTEKNIIKTWILQGALNN